MILIKNYLIFFSLFYTDTNFDLIRNKLILSVIFSMKDQLLVMSSYFWMVEKLTKHLLRLRDVAKNKPSFSLVYIFQDKELSYADKNQLYSIRGNLYKNGSDR